MSEVFGILNKESAYDVIAAKVEKSSPTLAAICASSWHLPIYRQTLTYELSSMRKMTAIEEYILKAADMKLSYNIDVSMLPSLFGLDEVFFDAVIDFLTAKGAIDKDALPTLKLTESGKSFLAQGKISAEATTDNIEYYIDRKFATVYATPSKEERIGMHPKCNAIDKAGENPRKYINRKFALEAAKTIGKEIENPKLGTRLTSIISAKTTDAAKALFSEIWFYDIADGTFVRKIWDHGRRCFHNELARLLDLAHIDSGYKLTAAKSNLISEAVRQLANEKDKLSICRGKAADEALTELICSAKAKITMHLPHLSDDIIAEITELCKSQVQNGVEVMVTYASCDDVTIPQTGITFQSKKSTGNITSITADSSKCIISGISWADHGAAAIACGDAVYVIDDEEFLKKMLNQA